MFERIEHLEREGGGFELTHLRAVQLCQFCYPLPRPKNQQKGGPSVHWRRDAMRLVLSTWMRKPATVTDALVCVQAGRGGFLLDPPAGARVLARPDTSLLFDPVQTPRGLARQWRCPNGCVFQATIDRPRLPGVEYHLARGSEKGDGLGVYGTLREAIAARNEASRGNKDAAHLKIRRLNEDGEQFAAIVGWLIHRARGGPRVLPPAGQAACGWRRTAGIIGWNRIDGASSSLRWFILTTAERTDQTPPGRLVTHVETASKERYSTKGRPLR